MITSSSVNAAQVVQHPNNANCYYSHCFSEHSELYTNYQLPPRPPPPEDLPPPKLDRLLPLRPRFATHNPHPEKSAPLFPSLTPCGPPTEP
eukprot:1178375-Prorocentrum_minimum.AAC.1